MVYSSRMGGKSPDPILPCFLDTGSGHVRLVRNRMVKGSRCRRWKKGE